METPEAQEVRLLRRCLRDIVAMTVLPSVWTGYDAAQICNDLVDVVMRAVDADAVLLTARAQGTVDVLRLRNEADADAARILREAANGPIRSGAHSSAGGELQVISYSLSAGSDDRIVAGAYRTDFATEFERLLLRVAANQASLWIERRDAEGRLRAESAFRRSIEDSMLAGVAAVDASGRQSYVNRAFVEMVGWPEAELLGAEPPFAYWAPEDSHNIHASLQEVLAGTARPSGYELRFRRRGEERFDALVLISALQPGAGGGFLAAVYDITERKNAERDSRFLAEAGGILGQSLDYESTLQSVSALAVPRLADWCFIDLVDSDAEFQRVAVAHADPADAALARRLHNVYAPSSTPYNVSRTFAGGQTLYRNDVTPELLDTLARDDEHRDALRALGTRAFVSVPMTSRGKTFGVITFCRTKGRTQFDPAEVALAEELTHRAALAVDNALLYREAQEANRAKDEFLANLSHELRTPMTAILGWAHLLELGGIEEAEVRVGIETIRQSGQAQAKLIDELLDVSRIITGKLHLITAPATVPDIVHAAVAAIRPAAEAKRQRLDLEIADSGSEDLHVLGDASRLQQVFWNLLSNAVKFTPAGGWIRVRVAREDAGVSVTVSDNGEGIGADLLPHVFERFRQATHSGGRRSGLGLGLAIAKELIELHGGSITVQSAGAGRGSTFAVTLPRHTGQERTLPLFASVAPGRQRLNGVRVLLVEDDETTRTLLDTLLRSFGAEVMAASGATAARDALASFPCDVLISDIEMPDDDGVALLQSLRGNGGLRFPAIAVTGYADETNRKRVLAAGFDGFVAKPLDPNALADEIERAIGRRR